MAAITLKHRLDALCVSVRDVALLNAAYEEMITDLNRSGFLQHAIEEGKAFPDFMLPSAEGRLVSLARMLANGGDPVVFSR